MMKKITIIVPIYNALDDVKICLKSLVENFNFTLGDVILINDCSNNETKEFLSHFSIPFNFHSGTTSGNILIFVIFEK